MPKPTLVIYRLGSLGDTVVALPCFHAIARRFGDYRRLVLTNEPVASVAPALETILGPSGLIHGVITYPVGARSIVKLLWLVFRVRATGADTLIYLTAGRGEAAVRRDLKFFRLCGLRTIVGAPLGELHDNLRDPDTGLTEPEAERLARTMAAIGPVDLQDRANWSLHLTEAELTAAEQAIEPLEGRPFFAVNVGGKAASNYWKPSKWEALFAELASRLGDRLSVVSVGAREDAARSRSLIETWTGRHLNLCGTISPRQSAAVLSKARFFVGHDSGPMHLSAATGTPTIGVFGNNNPPRMWHPYGSGHRGVQDIRGIDFVRVDQVRDAILDILGVLR